MEETLYHVVLEGRRMGPYDRRTIVGMRVRKTLTSRHVLIGADGVETTVAELLGEPRKDKFNPTRSGQFSVVRAVYVGALLAADKGALGVPAFQGEIEVRIQNTLIRIAGRFRQGFQWKEDRVKVPIQDVLHARARGRVVELWVHDSKGGPPQRIALDLASEESARDFLQWAPDATPPPQETPAPATRTRSSAGGSVTAVVIAVASVVLVVVAVLAVLLARRY